MKRRGFLSILFGAPAAAAASSVIPESKFKEDAMKVFKEPSQTSAPVAVFKVDQPSHVLEVCCTTIGAPTYDYRSFMNLTK